MGKLQLTQGCLLHSLNLVQTASAIGSMSIHQSEPRSISWLLDQLEDPLITLPIQGVAGSLKDALSDSEDDWVRTVGGVARKYWSVEAEHHYDKIGVLLGTAFVLGQTAIAQAVSIYIGIRDQFPGMEGWCRDKQGILNLAAEIENKSGLSEMVIIDSVANYFKHYHEWPSDWSEPQSRRSQANTIKRVKAVGMSSMYERTGNLWLAIDALDVRLLDIGKLTGKVVSWRHNLARHIYSTLGLEDPEQYEE